MIKESAETPKPQVTVLPPAGKEEMIESAKLDARYAHQRRVRLITSVPAGHGVIRGKIGESHQKREEQEQQIENELK